MDERNKQRYQSTTDMLTFIVAFIIMIIIITFVAQLSWNYTVPTLFGFKEINFLQMFVLIILTSILFK